MPVAWSASYDTARCQVQMACATLAEHKWSSFHVWAIWLTSDLAHKCLGALPIMTWSLTKMKRMASSVDCRCHLKRVRCLSVIAGWHTLECQIKQNMTECCQASKLTLPSGLLLMETSDGNMSSTSHTGRNRNACFWNTQLTLGPAMYSFRLKAASLLVTFWNTQFMLGLNVASEVVKHSQGSDQQTKNTDIYLYCRHRPKHKHRTQTLSKESPIPEERREKSN